MGCEYLRRNCHPLPFMLAVVILGQLILMVIATRATYVMRKEWDEVMGQLKNGPGSHELVVRIVKMTEFRGPTYAIVPVSCADLQEYDEESEAAVIANNDTELALATAKRRLLLADDIDVASSAPGTRETRGSERMDEVSRSGDFLSSPDVEWSPQVRARHTLRRLSAVNSLSNMSNEIGSENTFKQWTCNCFLDRLPFFGPQENGTRTVQACKKSIIYHTPHWWNRYFSLMELQKLRKGGTIEKGYELYMSRSYLYYMVIFCCFVTMAMKYSLKMVDLCTSFSGPRYIQLWQNDRTRVDRSIESLLSHSNAIIFTLALQLCLTSLYLTFWRDYYFVMQFIPSVGFWIFFITLIVFTLWMVLDRVRGWMVKRGDWYIYLFWISQILWMLFITVPMLGYCFYCFDFVWTVWQSQWIGRFGLFSPTFVRAANQAMSCAFGFIFLAVVDSIVIFAMDIDNH